jgi:hypothetical protein
MFRTDELQELAKNNQAKVTKGRPKRPKRKDYESEEAFQLALRDFRNILDRAAIEREAGRVLDDRNASVLRRRNARELLYGKDPEPVKVAESQSPEKSPRSRLSSAELVEERSRAEAFLDFIGKHGIPAESPRRQPEPPSKVEPRPTPVDPALYCEFCRVPFSICGCNATTCPLCLRLKANCYAPCPAARIRT